MAGWALSGTILESQGPAATRLDVAIDTGLFRAAGGRSSLEVYLGIDRALLTYDRVQGQPDVTLAAVALLKQHGQVVDFRELQVHDVLRGQTEIPRGRIPKLATFTPAPGTYLLQIVVEDQLGNKFDSTIQVVVPAYREWELGMSGIQIAALIRRSTSKNGEFYKHGLVVRPRASATYGGDHPLLWYFTVVYGVTHLDTVEIQATIWQDSVQVFSTGFKHSPSPALIYVDRGAINVTALNPGSYQLQLKAVAAGDSTTSTTPFQVAGSSAAPGDSGDGLAALPPDDLIDFAMGLHAAWPRLDVRRFRQANDLARGAMVRRFTDQLASIAGQDSSNFLDELLHRWTQVTAFDQLQQAPGRISRQGHALLLYGLPETIMVYPATRTRREYQIWTYAHPDSSKQITFIDGDGHGHFAPVHTTLPGAEALGWERNEDWRQQLPWVSVAEKVTAPTIPPAVAVPFPETIPLANSLHGDTSLVGEGRPDTLLMDGTLGDTTLEDTTLNSFIPDEIGLNNVPPRDTLTFPQQIPDTTGVEPTLAP